MSVYYQDHTVTVWHGDCIDVMRGIPDNSVDAIVTDPPYALPGGFMNKQWDAYDGREDAGFAYWLSGLIDGEGHFAIKQHSRGTHAPMFQLSMRLDERGTVERIQRHLGIGRITVVKHQPNAVVRWIVGDKAGCQRLVDLLDKYPLRAKKRMDYALWREAVCEWTNRPRGNRWHGGADNSHMAQLRERIMEGRRYVDPPWSGHEFQDWCRLWATEALRLLKPGGHLLAFGGTRTSHRLVSGIEDAGFEIRDSLVWLYGSGFPKSLDVSKAIDTKLWRDWLAAHPDEAARLDAIEDDDEHDAAELDLRRRAGFEREVVALRTDGFGAGSITSREVQAAMGYRPAGAPYPSDADGPFPVTAPATDAAQQWHGWGTALKPAHEPIVVARKPLTGTVAQNVLTWGCGALNIDATRIGTDDVLTGSGSPPLRYGRENARPFHEDAVPRGVNQNAAGRWPANVVLDEAAAARLDQQSGELTSGYMRPEVDRTRRQGDAFGEFSARTATETYGDTGGASRYFKVVEPDRFWYTAKASSSERVRVPGESLLRLRSDLTPEQVDYVTACLTEAGVSID